MALWVTKLQTMYWAVGLLLALIHLHSTWQGGEAGDTLVQSFVPGGVAGSQAPQRTLLQTKTKFPKVRAVNLGGWLVIEGWIKPELFSASNLPKDPDLLDGTRIRLRSTTTGLYYMSAEEGGGSVVSCNRSIASTWETFKVWRVSPGKYQLRVDNNKFMNAPNNGGGIVQATATLARGWEIFTFTRNGAMVHIQAGNGNYFQAVDKNQVTADLVTPPLWGSNTATFTIEIDDSFSLHGEYQLANAWGAGAPQAKTVFKNHRDNFIQESDFEWLSNNGINAVRLPVGWWIAYDSNPPAPYVSGSLQCLENAFKWGKAHNIKIIIDLHAAPGGQSAFEICSTRDGVAEWATNKTYRDQSIEVIDFLAKRYANNPALLGIELLNEPFQAVIPDISVVNDYYTTGYKTVRKYSKTTYVIMSQVIGHSDDEIVNMANLLPDDNVVMDYHPYNSFVPIYSTLSVEQNIAIVNNQRQDLIRRLNESNAYAFVGEWTAYFECCNGAPGKPNKQDYLKFTTAQENVFGHATFGWAFWSYRNAVDRWSYVTSATQGYMPRRPVN
ncbi:hypothetical protein M758_2G150800 [Ceratodon purpureus]|nr:hypothetical protein M758_2G150800 [Ceratodon purpureus]